MKLQNLYLTLLISLLNSQPLERPLSTTPTSSKLFHQSRSTSSKTCLLLTPTSPSFAQFARDSGRASGLGPMLLTPSYLPPGTIPDCTLWIQITRVLLQMISEPNWRLIDIPHPLGRISYQACLACRSSLCLNPTPLSFVS